MRIYIAILFCWAVLSGSEVFGTEQESKPEVVSKPEIMVEQIDPTERITIGEKLRIRVTVKNGSGTIELNRISVSPPEAFVLNYEKQKSRPFSILVPDGKNTLDPNEVLELGEIDFKGPSSLELCRWDTLTYRPKKEAIMGELSYVDMGGNSSERVIHILEVDGAANPLGLFAGAIVGTFLGAIFVTLFRVQKAVENLPTHKARDILTIIGKELGRAVFIFLKATVAAGIVILVLQSTSGVKFPIEVSVNDFYGGLVMGLVGERVASGVYEWIVKP